MMTGYPHTHIYIYRCRLMMHINRNEPTYNRQTGFQVPPVQCSLFALKPDVIIIIYHLSLYIYIHMCVSVCMCLLHLSRAKIFGTMRATSASAATRALSPMFLPRRWLSGGTGVPMLGSNSLPWKPEKLLWRRQVSWYPNISGSSHQKKNLSFSQSVPMIFPLANGKVGSSCKALLNCGASRASCTKILEAKSFITNAS